MAKMIRPKREALPNWTDKLNKTHDLIGRNDYEFEDSEYKYDIIEWTCLVNMFGMLKKKVIRSIVVKPLRKNRKISLLLTDSPYGVFCPNCCTNEYLSSTNDFRTGGAKLAHPGWYCKKCKRETL